MPQLTVTSEDTASAMDEIVSKLGQDAVILSTRRIGSQYEISATTDQISNLAPRRRRRESEPAETFMDVFSAAHKSMGKSQTAKTIAHDEIVDQRAGSDVEKSNISQLPTPPSPRPAGSEDYSSAPQTGYKAKPSIMDALLSPPTGSDAWQISDQIQALAEQLQTFENNLKGLVITETSFIDQSMGPTLSLQLRQSGFSEKIIQRFSQSFVGKAPEIGRADFMKAISQTISVNCMDTLAASKVILVTGGRGSGKTSFCGKLATLMLETHPLTPISLGEFSGSNPNPNADLRNQARLMNLPINKINTANLDVTIESMRGRVIIDCDGDANEAKQLIKQLNMSEASGGIVQFMTIPGTSNARAITKQCEAANADGALIALTRLDECEIAAEEASIFCELDKKIAFLTASRSFIDRLAIASEEAMAQYLTENC